MDTNTSSLLSDFNNLSLDDLFSQIRVSQSAKKQEEFKLSNVNGVGHAVGYTRVSTEMQVKDGHSLEDQRQKIQDFCTTKKLILDAVYDEPGLSGANRNRPKLKELLTVLIPGMKVICYSIDRLARDTSYLLDIKNTIHEKGCTLYIIDRHIDTADKSHDFLVTVMAAIADENRQASNARVSSVMTNMSREGKLRGKPRFGWKVIKGDDGKNQLVEDPEEQKVITVIKKLIQLDPKITLSEISRRLKSNDIQIRKSAQIYTTTLKNIIEQNHLRDLQPN